MIAEDIKNKFDDDFRENETRKPKLDSVGCYSAAINSNTYC